MLLRNECQRPIEIYNVDFGFDALVAHLEAGEERMVKGSYGHEWCVRATPPPSAAYTPPCAAAHNIVALCLCVCVCVCWIRYAVTASPSFIELGVYFVDRPDLPLDKRTFRVDCAVLPASLRAGGTGDDECAAGTLERHVPLREDEIEDPAERRLMHGRRHNEWTRYHMSKAQPSAVRHFTPLGYAKSHVKDVSPEGYRRAMEFYNKHRDTKSEVDEEWQADNTVRCVTVSVCVCV